MLLHQFKLGDSVCTLTKWEQRQICGSRGRFTGAGRGGGGERLVLDLWSHPLPALQYPVEA